MAWYVYVIIGFVVLSYFQYSSPEKTNNYLDPVYGKVKESINKNPISNSASDNSGVTCPDTDDPVCGSDGNTYKNSCEAALADVLEVTPGAC